MNVDTLLENLHPLGRWQATQMSLIFGSFFQAAFHLVSIVIIGHKSNYSCILPENVAEVDTMGKNSTTTSLDQCSFLNLTTNDTTACSRWGFEDDVPTTITEEWSLVCGKRYQVSLSQTLLIAGQAVGAPTFSALSDCFGRKRILLISQTVVLLVTFATSFVPYMWIFIVLRFLTGFAQQGIVTSSSVLIMELTTIKHRTVIAAGLEGIMFSFSLCTLVMIGFFFRHENWRYLQMALSLQGAIFLLLQAVFLDESLRWLLAKCKNRDGLELIKKIYKQNKVDNNDYLTNVSALLNLRSERSGHVQSGTMDHGTTTVQNDPGVSCDSKDNGAPPKDPQAQGNVSAHASSEITPKTTISLILRNSKLRITTVLFAWVWISCALVYFGTTMMAATLSGDRFLNFFLLCAVEAPSAVIGYFSLKWLGRKKTLYIWQVVTSTSLGLYAFLHTSDEVPVWVNTLLWMLAKFAISLIFTTLFTYTPELYPTKYRNLGLGIESSVSRVGGMIAPFCVYLLDVSTWLPGILFCACSLLACVAILPLPETVHADLPANLDEVNQLWNNRKSKTEKKGNTSLIITRL